MATAPLLDTTGTDIVPANNNANIVLFDGAKFDAFYDKLKAEADAVPVDLTTVKGRAAIASAAIARAEDMLRDIIYRMETVDALVLRNSHLMLDGMVTGLTDKAHFWIRNAKAELACITPGTCGRWGANGYGPAIADDEASARWHVQRAINNQERVA